MRCALQSGAMTPPTLNRRQLLATLSASTAAMALPASARPFRSTNTAAESAVFLDAIAWNLLGRSPEGATSLGVDTGSHAALRSSLSDRSAAGMHSLAVQLRKDVAHVKAVDPRTLAPAIRTSFNVVQSAYGVALDGLALPYGDVAVGGWRNTPYAVVQNVGAYLDTPRFLDADHPVRNASDAEAYLARLAGMAAQLDGELGRIASARRIGLVPPSFLLDKTIAQMKQSIADAQKNGGGLVQSLVGRTRDIPGDWQRRAAAIVGAKVLPALNRQLAEITAQRAIATSDAGMGARPHGAAFYEWALRASTTTRNTPDAVHAMGREQVAELHGRMDPILRGLGFTSGTVGERMTALGKDPRFKFSPDDSGRAEIIALMQRKLAYIRTRLPDAFRTLVRGNLEIRRLPLAEEAGAPAAYGGAGSIDGSIPGKVWVNLGETDRHSRYSVPDLVFHEGIPGHVWQGEYANKLPLIRSILAFNAYSEGWALYAEQLADELGAYDGDAVGRLGYLQSLAFRACRMVVDTGLHAKGWSRDQAIDWFATTNGSGRTEVSSEVDRYCSWPGQACGYKMGHSEIIRQRARAQAALGDRFDLRDFDQAVVDGGNVPLDVLAQNIDGYINDFGEIRVLR